MPFNGPNPYGTAGGVDDILLPTNPLVSRVANNGTHTAFLIVNGPITVRQREQIEAVVRTLGSRGETIVTIVIRDNGGIIDSNVSDINATDGIRVTFVSPGAVMIDIPPDGITGDMIANAVITGAKIANGSITNDHIVNGTINDVKLATKYIQRGQVYTFDIDTWTLPAGAAANVLLGTSNTVFIPNGTYLYVLNSVIHLEGSGAAVEGSAGAYHNGVEFAVSGYRKAEGGVNSDWTLNRVSTYAQATSQNVTFTYYFRRSTGTANLFAANFSLAMIRIG